MRSGDIQIRLVLVKKLYFSTIAWQLYVNASMVKCITILELVIAIL